MNVALKEFCSFIFEFFADQTNEDVEKDEGCVGVFNMS